MMEEVQHRMLNEEPRCDEGQTAVLSIKSIMVRVEGEVIEVEKSKPVPLRNRCVATNCIVLISDPHDQYNVESSRGVIKEFRHDRFHPDKSQEHRK